MGYIRELRRLGRAISSGTSAGLNSVCRKETSVPGVDVSGEKGTSMEYPHVCTPTKRDRPTDMDTAVPTERLRLRLSCTFRKECGTRSSSPVIHDPAHSVTRTKAGARNSAPATRPGYPSQKKIHLRVSTSRPGRSRAAGWRHTHASPAITDHTGTRLTFPMNPEEGTAASSGDWREARHAGMMEASKAPPTAHAAAASTVVQVRTGTEEEPSSRRYTRQKPAARPPSSAGMHRKSPSPTISSAICMRLIPSARIRASLRVRSLTPMLRVVKMMKTQENRTSQTDISALSFWERTERSLESRWIMESVSATTAEAWASSCRRPSTNSFLSTPSLS